MFGTAQATVMKNGKTPTPLKIGVHNLEKETDKCQLIMTSHPIVVFCNSCTEKIQQEHESEGDWFWPLGAERLKQKAYSSL